VVAACKLRKCPPQVRLADPALWATEVIHYVTAVYTCKSSNKLSLFSSKCCRNNHPITVTSRKLCIAATATACDLDSSAAFASWSVC
jgi:hypothetical protein